MQFSKNGKDGAWVAQRFQRCEQENQETTAPSVERGTRSSAERAN
jgi:hypothetical protein